MTYQLGVDIGTTKIAAAVRDAGQTRPVQLGNRSTAIPSVVFLRDDGTLLFGEAAQRRADSEPNRAAVEFKRRVGDPVPIRLAGTPFSAQQLMALTLTWVIERVTQLEGQPPATIVLTHPANWGPYKRESFLSALRDADIQTARLIPEPVAAAIHFDSERRVAPGETVAIYDLGGGTFDAAVLRRDAAEFEILGNPGGIDTLGGMEFDDAVLGQVWAAIGGPVTTADPARMAALRREVVDAKEHLSADLSADVVVDLLEERRSVLIRRSELEELIRPLLDQTVDSLKRSFTRSGVNVADLAAVVLVGGSSRIPLVTEVLQSRLGCPVVLDSQPQLAIALGAAISTVLPVELPIEESPILPLPIVDRLDPPTEVFAPPAEVFASSAEVFAPSTEVFASSADPEGRPDPDAAAGAPATRRRAIPNSPRLPVLLIGTGIAIAALISGINAATSLSGGSGGDEEKLVGTTSTATTASGLQAPLGSTSTPWSIPSRASSTQTRAPRSQPSPVKRTSTPIRTTSRPTSEPEPTATTSAPKPTTDPPQSTEPPQTSAGPPSVEPTIQPTEPEDAANP